MPRKPKNFQIGGVYHVIKRGIDGRKTFVTEQDFSRFILSLEFFNTEKETDLWSLFFYKKKSIGGNDPPMDTLRDVLRKERAEKKEEDKIVEVLGFCLMSNHYHLILREIKEGGISLFMCKLGGYSSYFNDQHKRSGSLFQRYKLVPVETNDQLVVLFHYVHTNPIEIWEPGWKDFQVKDHKEAIEKLYNYKHSSLLDYVGEINYPTVTDRDFFLRLFGGTEKCKEEIENWIKYKAKSQ